jgi:hypothetical protein
MDRLDDPPHEGKSHQELNDDCQDKFHGRQVSVGSQGRKPRFWQSQVLPR